MNRRPIILIFVYAAAAAASFLGPMLLSARLKHVPWFLVLPVGLLGLSYFVKQAEAQRDKLRRS